VKTRKGKGELVSAMSKGPHFAEGPH